MFSMQDFEAVPKIFMSRRQVVYFFLSSGIFTSLPHKRFQTGLCLFWHGQLSSLSPPHWAYISALWRQVNVTKHGAMRQRQTPDCLHCEQFMLVCAVVSLSDSFIWYFKSFVQRIFCLNSLKFYLLEQTQMYSEGKLVVPLCLSWTSRTYVGVATEDDFKPSQKLFFFLLSPQSPECSVNRAEAKILEYCENVSCLRFLL